MDTNIIQKFNEQYPKLTEEDKRKVNCQIEFLLALQKAKKSSDGAKG